jgi:NADPH:quinone reductase-like Zn-dependent oxidoreductase
MTVPTHMRAATYHRYGRPEEVVSVRDVPVPEPGPGEVLVEVRAASVNALDWHFVTGLPMFARPTLGLRRPKRTVPGADVSGVVAAVGPDVTGWAVGDEVLGEVHGGGFAEYVVAPADWLVAKPASLSFEQAATIGVAAETAIQGLRDWGSLREGESVLVNGASGGVGTFAVQVAKALGAGHVTAVCSTLNVETALKLGADRVVDYTREDAARLLRSSGTTYDVLFDNAGVWPLRTCSRMLAEGGRYVMVTSPKSRWLRPAAADARQPAVLRDRARHLGRLQGRRAQHPRPRAARGLGRQRRHHAGPGPALRPRGRRRGAARAGGVPRPREVGRRPLTRRWSRKDEVLSRDPGQDPRIPRRVS